METLTTKQKETIEELKEQLQRTQKELSILYNVSKAMRMSLELNDVLYIILTSVTAHTGLGFNRAVLLLVNPVERCLEPRMAISPDSGEDAQKIWGYIKSANQHLEDLIEKDKIEQNKSQSSLYQSIKDIKIPLDKNKSNLLAQAYHKGSHTRISKERINFSQNDPLLKTFKTNELVIMPLKAKDKVNGLIIADNYYTQKSITDDDLKIFMMLANQAGLAIENSRLYEIVIHQSHTDPITNLWNHRFFQEQLSREIQIASEKEIPISLIMLDLDNFKSLNDTYGHQIGDSVLMEIALILKDSCREIDFACRYGGEEFAIILPQTNEKQGYAIAERIRKKIEQHAFVQKKDIGSIPITISVGISSLSGWVTTKEDLITAADKAMYKAKFGGKNQTALSDD